MSELDNLESAGKKTGADTVAAIKAEEMTLYRFLEAHKGIALQCALLVAVPVGIVCFLVGQHVGR